MTRMLILAAAAAALALPASAQSIRISTAGKTPEQVRTEVVKAASKLCALETYGASFPIDEMRACVAATTRSTLAQAADPKVRLAANR
jgi:ABC-type proline/glycine betaine transport system substrate-binding protein